MKKEFVLAALIWGSVSSGQCQLLLNQGQDYTYTFDTLPLAGQVFTPPPGQGQFGKFTLSIATGPVMQDSQLLVEFYQNDLGDTPAFSQLLNFPAGPSIQFRVGNLWEDLQGGLRMSMVQGQALISSFLLEVELPTATPGLANLYSSGAVVPIPEPSSYAFAGLGLATLAGLVVYRRRAKSDRLLAA